MRSGISDYIGHGVTKTCTYVRTYIHTYVHTGFMYTCQSASVRHESPSLGVCIAMTMGLT